MAKRPPVKPRAPREIEVKPEGAAPGTPRLPAPLPMRSIIGQERAVAVLQNALRSERVHHAWIFHGPAGVGKFTAALSFAATLLSPAGSPSKDGLIESASEGEGAALLRAGTHPDLRVIVKELAPFSRDARVRTSKQRVIPKEVVDEFLVEPATRSGLGLSGPARAGRVFIVDEAEYLEPPSQNVLLKTLEEPPAGTVIILVTSAEDQLLPTIRSRAQRVGFAPLAPGDMDRWLKASGREVPGAQRAWLLAHASGSPGVLIEALDHGLFSWHERLAPLLAEVSGGRFAPALGGTMAELAEEWAKGWVEKRPGASKDSANKDGADKVLRMVGEFFRARLRAGPGAGPDLRAIELVHEAGRQTDANVNIALALGNLAAQLFDVYSGAGRLTPAR